MQPKIDNIDETSQKGKYIQQIRKKFDALSGETESDFESISSETGSTLQPGPNKKIERIFEKANLSYSGNLCHVTDYKCLRHFWTKYLKDLLLLIFDREKFLGIHRIRNLGWIDTIEKFAWICLISVFLDMNQ